jgi:membrane fusion protein (multidrug efflux system)
MKSRVSGQAAQRALLVLVVIAAAVGTGLYYYLGRNSVTTDDAYVNAHVVQVSAQVTGPVLTLSVHNNEQVARGALLFAVDPAPFKLHVQDAEQQLALARQGVAERGAAVAQAQAVVAQRKAELASAESRAGRTLRLVSEDVMTHEAGDTARTGIDAARAAVAAAEASLRAAEAQLGDAGDNNAQVRAAQARLAQAQLDLQHTEVVAPDDGFVTSLNLRPGAIVMADQPLFAFVSTHDWWLDANFKETQLERLRPQQKAELRVDMYPGHVFHGVVDSISRGSGTAFSLLPAQNATGNWVKVTQRVPVKIVVTDPDPAFPLRIGTSASVSVDVSG